MGDVVLEWVTPYILTQKRRLIKAITLSAAVVLRLMRSCLCLFSGLL